MGQLLQPKMTTSTSIAPSLPLLPKMELTYVAGIVLLHQDSSVATTFETPDFDPIVVFESFVFGVCSPYDSIGSKIHTPTYRQLTSFRFHRIRVCVACRSGNRAHKVHLIVYVRNWIWS